MKLPPEVTEAQFLASANKVANILASTFKFGCYEVEDIKQEALMIAWKSMAQYDVSRPLDNFLYRNVRNRLINFRRDHHHRNDPPCVSCHNSIPGETEHNDGQFCLKYAEWFNRNVVKHNVRYPIDIDIISDESEANTRCPSQAEGEAQRNEAMASIDAGLPAELRSTYLKMLAGESVPKSKKILVENTIREILGGVTWQNGD